VRFLSFAADGTLPQPSLRAAFVEAWNARLGRTPHANFTMSLDYLDWQSHRGESARAILLDDGQRHGAMVLRERDVEIVCGWPWRWQMVIEGADPASPPGMTAEDAAWFFAQARRLASGRRLRFYSPHSVNSAITYRAARTALIRLAPTSEQELFSGMSSSRRNLVRRSEKQGFVVTGDPSPAQQRAFGALVHDTHARRHGGEVSCNPDPPELEWAQPWHWLFVGIRDAEVVSGLGLGRFTGGMVDSRASGSTEEAMKAGANSLVWWEAIRQARLADHSWMNLCGSTVFKRQYGGREMTIYCALGGGKRWLALQLTEKLRVEAIAFAGRARRHLRTLLDVVANRTRRRDAPARKRPSG
jgi:hypothetical protein